MQGAAQCLESCQIVLNHLEVSVMQLPTYALCCGPYCSSCLLDLWQRSQHDNELVHGMVMAVSYTAERRVSCTADVVDV